MCIPAEGVGAGLYAIRVCAGIWMEKAHGLSQCVSGNICILQCRIDLSGK